jgi:urease accessory protein
MRHEADSRHPRLSQASKTAYLRVRAGIGGEPIVQNMEASYASAFQPTPWGAWLTGVASQPVAGDDLHIRFDVGVGCCAEVRSMNPTVATASSPGADILPSASTTNVTVARDAMLAWCPEPGVARGQTDHSNHVTVKLGANSRLLWVDEFQVQPLTGQPVGTWGSRLRVAREGWPVVSYELGIGPRSPLWESQAILGGTRAVTSIVIVDPDHPRETWSYERAQSDDAMVKGVCLPLSGPGAQFLVWGPELAECRAVLGQMLEPAGVPAWVVTRLRTVAFAGRGSLRGLPA